MTECIILELLSQGICMWHSEALILNDFIQMHTAMMRKWILILTTIEQNHFNGQMFVHTDDIKSF